jgi:hypothetical protein
MAGGTDTAAAASHLVHLTTAQLQDVVGTLPTAYADLLRQCVHELHVTGLDLLAALDSDGHDLLRRWLRNVAEDEAEVEAMANILGRAAHDGLLVQRA